MKGLITLNSKKLNLKILTIINPYYMYTCQWIWETTFNIIICA